MKRLKFPKIQLLDDDYSDGIPRGNITYILAFIIPLIMFIALYYARNIFPFGTNCYLRSDMYHQYAPFFSEFWDKLATGGSLTYSWDIGMGTNFTALYAYYLASPANWLIVLFPQKYMIEIMNALIILKLSGASLSFTYYIAKRFNSKSCLVALFGMFYGMSGFVAAYSWNIMWLDCIILIPLILLGLERLVNENKCILFCVSLGLCIYSNYYISIMVCMTVILYFIVLMVAFNGPYHFTIYLKKLFNFALFSLLAGGLAACLLLPEMYAFSLSVSSKISFPQTLSTYFPIMEMLVRQLINVPVHLGLEHYPNIYCGVAIFLLLPLYIMNPKINTRQKAGKVILLLVFLTAFNMNIPNFVWHGFHFPNSLPCRQSFIYIFFLLSMSYEAFHDMKDYSKKQITGAFWIAVAFFVLAEQLYAGAKYDFKIMYISAAFLMVYMLLIYLFLHSRFKKPVLLFFIFTIAIVECTINMDATGIGTTGRTGYVNDNKAVSNVVDRAAENDPSFYRIEKVSGIRSKNDSAWHNYKSISTFSSTANAGVTDLYGALGCEHSTNAYAAKGSNMLTSSIFDVKYFLGNRLMTESNLLKLYTSNNGEFLYENKYTLPVGFMVNSNINDAWNTDITKNGIDVQNDFVKLNTGVSNLFTKVADYGPKSDVTITPAENGHMYLIVQSANIQSISVTVNDTVNTYSGLDDSNYIIDIGFVSTTDNIRASSDSAMNLLAYSLDSSKFITAINTLNQCGLNVTTHSDTKIEGNVTTTNDGVMFFSIPFDKGWTVRVDGEKVDTFAIKNALLGINLSTGYHTVSLSYTPVGLIKGLLISLICILILIAMVLFRKFEKSGRISTKKLPLFLQNFLSEEDVPKKATIKKGIAKSRADTTVDFTSDLTTDVTADFTTDLTTDVTADFTTDLTTDVTADIDYMDNSDYNSKDDFTDSSFDNHFGTDLNNNMDHLLDDNLESYLEEELANYYEENTKY